MIRYAPASDEWAALISGMEESRPSCRGDHRFTADREDLDTTTTEQMRAVCNTCPLLPICYAYASTEQPPGGFWAGDHWGKKT